MSEMVKILTSNLEAHASNLDTTQKSSQVYIYIYTLTALQTFETSEATRPPTLRHVPKDLYPQVFGVPSP